MSVIERLKPVENHTSSIPPMLRRACASFDLTTDKAMLDVTKGVYDAYLRMIDKLLSGQDAWALDDEDKAARLAACFMIDAAFIHNALSRAGCLIGEFPYDHLVDAVIPSKNDNK